MKDKEFQNVGIDYEDWATKAYWTIDEAVGLALDIDPDRQMGPLERYRILLSEPWESTADPTFIGIAMPEVSEIFSGWREVDWDVSEKWKVVIDSLKADKEKARKELTNLGIDDIDSIYNKLTTLRERVKRAIEADVLQTLSTSSEKLSPPDFIHWCKDKGYSLPEELLLATQGHNQTPQDLGGQSTKKRWDERDREIVRLANELIKEKKLSGDRGDLTKLAKEVHKRLIRLKTKTTKWTVSKNFQAIRDKINDLIAEKKINWWNPN